MKEYRGASGKNYTVNPEPLAKGGEGVIYEIEGHDDIVAKVFREDKRTPRRREKLSLMVRYRLTELQRQQVTWPLDVIYEGDDFVGYIMPRIHSAADFSLVCGADIAKLNLEDRLIIAYNTCAAVDTVHSFGQVCGDLNPQNICVNLDNTDSKSALMVTLVDTDSYHIVNGQMMYRCEVGQANYLPPELQKRLYQGGSLSDMPLPTYNKETDRFALAVHLFCLFMNGCHPFACALDTEADIDESVDIPQPTVNIREGFSPFFSKKNGIMPPAYAPEMEALPQSFQDLFRRTFVDGYSDPSVRASAREWMDAIMVILQNKDYIKCPDGHYYFIHRLQCPYCAIRKRTRKLQLEMEAAAEPAAETAAAQDTTPPPQQPLVHEPTGWQSASTINGGVRNRQKEELSASEFIKKHVVILLYVAIFIALVLFIMWYIRS